MNAVSKIKIKNNVFTVIVTFNGIQWINECLESVINDSTVIVVDNLSTDGTVDFIKENFQDVIILEQDQNYGFGYANNIGISYALENNAEFVLLLNQDAKLDGGCITKLSEASISNKNYGILSPIHCDWNGEYLETSFARYLSQESNKDFYSDFVLGKSKQIVYEVPFIAAACWFIKKNVFETVGGFDPIFKHLGEDVNLTQRIIYHGFKIGVLSNCKVMHDTGNRASEKVEKFSEKYYYKLDYRSKMKYANLNIQNWKEKLSYAKNQIKKEVILSLLRLKFSDIKGYMMHIKKLNVIEEQCEKSRSINKVKGSHYLNN